MTTFTIGVISALIAVLYACERSNLGKSSRRSRQRRHRRVGRARRRRDEAAVPRPCSFAVASARAAGAYQQHHQPGDFGYACVVYAFAYMKIGGTRISSLGAGQRC